MSEQEHKVLGDWTGMFNNDNKRKVVSGIKSAGIKAKDYLIWHQENPDKGWVSYLKYLNEREKKKKLIKV